MVYPLRTGGQFLPLPPILFTPCIPVTFSFARYNGQTRGLACMPLLFTPLIYPRSSDSSIDCCIMTDCLFPDDGSCGYSCNDTRRSPPPCMYSPLLTLLCPSLNLYLDLSRPHDGDCACDGQQLITPLLPFPAATYTTFWAESYRPALSWDFSPFSFCLNVSGNPLVFVDTNMVIFIFSGSSSGPVPFIPNRVCHSTPGNRRKSTRV